MTDDDGMDAAGGLGTTMKTGVNEDIMSWKQTDHDDQLSPRRAVEYFMRPSITFWEEDIQDLINTPICR